MAHIGPFGTPFLTPKLPLKKFLWVLFLRSFPGNEAHKLFSFFLGVQNGVFWVGGQRVYVEKVYVLVLCLKTPLSLTHPHCLCGSPNLVCMGVDGARVRSGSTVRLLR